MSDGVTLNKPERYVISRQFRSYFETTLFYIWFTWFVRQNSRPRSILKLNNHPKLYFWTSNLRFRFLAVHVHVNYPSSFISFDGNIKSSGPRAIWSCNNSLWQTFFCLVFQSYNLRVQVSLKRQISDPYYSKHKPVTTYRNYTLHKFRFHTETKLFGETQKQTQRALGLKFYSILTLNLKVKLNSRNCMVHSFPCNFS